MNRFYLIPAQTIDIGDGNTSTFPKYLRNFRNPDGYPCRFSVSRYGRQNLWLVRVMDISDVDGAALAAQPDVYAFPLDENLATAISDKAVVDAYFEGFRVPTDWTNPSTQYMELIRVLAHIADILQRYFGIHGQELFETANLDTRYRDLTAGEQFDLRLAIEEMAGQTVPINQNSTLRQLMKSGADLMMSKAITIGDLIL